jgi:transposase
MIIPPVCVGIDVSKHTLDVFREGSGYSRIANEAQSVADLVAGLDADCFVVFEATGHYDAVLRKALERAGVAFARINPEQARHFAKAIGRLAKTDRVDARMLAEFGRRLAPKPEPARDPAREALALLHKRRDQLVAMRHQERVRLRECAHAGVGDGLVEGLVEGLLEGLLDEGLARHVVWLDGQIAAIEARIAALVGREPALREAGERLRSIPGIGPVTAATLLALMPELGARQPKPLAALAGLAPFNADSGRSQGHRCIKKGRARVRRALYMAALSAAQGKSRLAQKYRALREAGKPPKLALVAIARKILTIANAVLRDQTSFSHA